MNLHLHSHYVILTFDSFGNFKHIKLAAKEQALHPLALTGAERHELARAYQTFILADQAQIQHQAQQAKGTNTAQDVHTLYRLVLDETSTIVQKINSQQVLAHTLADHQLVRMVKPKAEDTRITRLTILEDLPAELQKSVGEFLTFEDGQGLLGVSRKVRAAVINRQYALLRPAELALVMDITGSMTSQLNEAKTMLDTILRTLNHSMVPQGFYQRSAWLGYRDLKDAEPFHLRDFSTDPAVISRYIQNTTASGGGDRPEDVAGAMHILLHDLSWIKHPHARGLKNAVWVLDAPPHGMGTAGDDYPNGTPDHDWLALAHRMKASGVVIHPVVCGIDPHIEELQMFATTVANITGGTCVLLRPQATMGALSQQMIACITRDVELQQALETEINRRLLAAQRQAITVEITPELLSSYANEAVAALSTSDAYQITELQETQLPLTNAAARLSLCHSQDDARIEGLLPAVQPFAPPRAQALYAPLFAGDHMTTTLPEDGFVEHAAYPVIPSLSLLRRQVTEGGSTHYRYESSSSSAGMAAKKHKVAALETVHETDEAAEKMATEDLGYFIPAAKKVSLMGLFANPPAATTSPLRASSCSAVSTVPSAELAHHARRVASSMERSFSCADETKPFL